MNGTGHGEVVGLSGVVDLDNPLEVNDTVGLLADLKGLGGSDSRRGGLSEDESHHDGEDVENEVHLGIWGNVRMDVVVNWKGQDVLEIAVFEGF